MISVIVPCYNLELYIEECLQSIIQQDYPDFELIVVDDCSTDRSVELIRAIADPRLRLIALDENEGAGVSRNVGLRAAKGEYIAFIDGDDVIGPCYLSGMLRCLLEYDADFVQSDSKLLQPDENGVYHKDVLGYYLMEPEVYPADKVERLEKLLKDEYKVEAHQKLIKREFLERLGLEFEIRYCQDLLWFIPLLYHAKTIVFTPYIQYHYRVRPNSITTSHGTKEARIALESLAGALVKLEDYLLEMELDLTQKMELRLFTVRRIFDYRVRGCSNGVDKEVLYNIAAEVFHDYFPTASGLLVYLYRDYLLQRLDLEEK